MLWSPSASMEQVRSALPGPYRSWVLGAIGWTLAAYAVASGLRFAGGGTVREWFATLEPGALVALGVAFALARADDHARAAPLAIGSVWIQLVAATAREGIRGGDAPFFLVLTLAASLLLGPSWALALAVATTVALPIGIVLAGALGAPGLPPADLPALAGFLVALWGIAVLLTSLHHAVWMLLRRARTNELRVAAMVDGNPDAIVGLGPDGLVDAFNPAAERALGVRAGDALGRPFSALPLRAVEGNALETHSGPRELEVRGTDTILESRVRRIPATERGTRLLLVLRDVTARRRAEARAAELKGQLEHAQRLEAVGRLAGGVAHDFNNLLTAVGGGAAFLQDHHDPEVREIAGELRMAQERGATLTRRLLSFARKEVTTPRVIDLASFLEQERPLLQRVVGERVVLDLDPVGPAPIFLDEGQLQQVLLNLAVNARDAMNDHGTLYVGCRVDGTHVALSVRDTGAGMSEEVQRHLFEPFFTTKGSGGTGLGLSTVHGIVSTGGGTIDVDSAVGRGSNFRIRLPRAPDLPVAPVADARQPPARRKGRILLVEDDDLTRDFARRALTRMGHVVEVARNGGEGLDRIGRDEAYDLVLSDVSMPVMTGPELLARLREQGRQIPVLLMSGYVDDVLRDGTFDTTTELLLKPFSMDELSRRVDDALRRGA